MIPRESRENLTKLDIFPYIHHAKGGSDGVAHIRIAGSLQNFVILRAAVGDGLVAGTSLVFIKSQLQTVQHTVFYNV